MSKKPNDLRSVLSRNRAEELGRDVWKHFVVPRFFDQLDFHATRKPMVLVGGRGCGKTMLLRYLSHDSAFSSSRPNASVSDVDHIGLYWKADTQFASMMAKRGFDDDYWISAFNHLAALVLGTEVLRSVINIADRLKSAITRSDLQNLTFLQTRAFDNSLPATTIYDLLTSMQGKIAEFETWVNNARTEQPPKFLPGTSFVQVLIRELQSQLTALNASTYFVYIDEYENLASYQQQLINTWVKHSEPPLIFNLAMKRNGFSTRQTVGNEYLSDIHDFRTHDLEQYVSDEFDVFAAEILFLHLSLAQLIDLPVNEKVLRDVNELPFRRTSGYMKSIVSAAEFLLPDIPNKELGAMVFQDPALLKKLRTRIEVALKRRNSRVAADRFLRPSLAQASVVVPVLLHRQSLSPEDIEAELDALEKGQPSRFGGTTDWVGNNFVGALLQIYEPHSRACPFYAGFHSFCCLAHGNLRHFLELCYKCIYASSRHMANSIFPVTADDQAEAARQASTALLGEVKSFGRLGTRLHSFVHRLGTLFQLAHQRPTQSESEQSHFGLTSGDQLTDEDMGFLREAVKWSVLFDEPGTKKKEKYMPESSDYVLNPIYSPYFHISYRKKRKLELGTNELSVLIRGNLEEVKSLLNRFSKEWEVDAEELVPSLFSNVSGD